MSHVYEYTAIQFCGRCETAYTMAVIDKQLKLLCRNCGHEETTKNIVVSRTLSDDGGHDKTALVNRFTKHDDTLPVTSKKACPHCGKRQAKFMRYSDDSMALLFLCLHCDHLWKK